MSTFANSEDPAKCSIMLHFIKVYSICQGEKDLQTKEYNFYAPKGTLGGI